MGVLGCIVFAALSLRRSNTEQSEKMAVTLSTISRRLSGKELERDREAVDMYEDDVVGDLRSAAIRTLSCI